MKLASRSAGADGRLLIVSHDLSRVVEAEAAATMQQALDDWTVVEPRLRAQSEALNRDAIAGAPLDPISLTSALPRSYQFLDASAFLAHNHILADAWGFARRADADPPLMYQGLSDRFYPAHGEVPFRSEADNIDFEAEYGVILDETPLAVTGSAALGHARLVVIINDWSLRAFGPAEMRAGFGFLHAKPPSAMSAIAVTPDELGAGWRDGRVCLPLQVRRGDELFGQPLGDAMSYGFERLIEHAAATRDLCAGTVIGSGTVSNFNAATVGSGCIAERQALDTIAGREPTPYLRFGERVRLRAGLDGQPSPFGEMDQRVVARPMPA